LSEDPADLVKSQLLFLQELAKLICDEEMSHAHRSAHWDQHSQKVMGEKNLSVMALLLKRCPDQFFDDTLIDELYTGFKLVGGEPYKHAFEYDPHLPLSTVQALQQGPPPRETTQ
jgi:hypothetical protein